MKKLLTVALVGAAGFAGYKWFTKQQALVKSVSFTFSDISLDFKKTLKAAFANVYLTIKVDLTNPSALAVIMNGIHADVTYNGNIIGTIDQDVNQSIAANGISSLTIPVVLSTANAINTISDAITNQNITLTFDGYIDFNVGQVQFNETKTFNT